MLLSKPIQDYFRSKSKEELEYELHVTNEQDMEIAREDLESAMNAYLYTMDTRAFVATLLNTM